MAFRYPISLELQGRRCVVVGGGQLGEHKAMALVEAGAAVTVISESVTSGLEEAARRDEVKLIRRAYSRGDLDGAFLAIAATDDAEVNAEIFDEAEAGRVLLNAVDDVAHCHFALPSIVRRGDFAVAISTGGKAPALAKRLRGELSHQFGPEYGVLVDLLGEVREQALATRDSDFNTWARRWQRALDHDLTGMVAEGRIDEVRQVVRRALAGVPKDRSDSGRTEGATTRKGRVWIVGAGPGDPGLITMRGNHALSAADVVVYDRLVNPALIAGKEAIFAGKEPGRHHIRQDDINALLINLAAEGKNVVRLKGGDPFVFGRGGEEAEALAEADIDFEVVPAPTSAVAALAYAGIPVTDRRVASSVAFVTGHCAHDGEPDWAALATSVDTIVVFMGVQRLAHIVDRLIEGGRHPATPAAIIENGTMPEQRVITADLMELPLAASMSEISSPALVVVGEVIRLRERISWFRERHAAIPADGLATV